MNNEAPRKPITICPLCEDCEGCPEGPRTALSLAEAFVSEQARVREIQRQYYALPYGTGAIGAAMMEASLTEADAAVMARDLPRMIVAYNDLKGYDL